MSDNQNSAKKLITNLFAYVKEIKNRLDKPVLNEAKYDWLLNLEELPDHPYIFKKSTDEYFLKVKRPKIIECPKPPDLISEWIKPSWKFIDKELDYLKSKNIKNSDGTVTTILIEDFPEVIQEIEKWRKVRELWREAEKPSEDVRKVFSYLHEVKSRIEKDSESNQLYLTEGVLTQKTELLDVRHPLIYKELGVELIGNLPEPEILITKSTTESAIYVTVLRSLEVNGATLNQIKEEFKELDLDPDDDKIDLFLKNIVHRLWQDGQFSEVPVSLNKNPTVFLQQKLLLGKKESSFAEQIDNYIAKIDTLDELPVAYQNMVGHFKERNVRLPELPGKETNNLNTAKKQRSYYLTKEYNTEQKKIINLLEDHGCVSVQGPPGTGKTHTIANLVGHLLAKGESVLVSSYRSKALEVIRDQVVENIRPLCVSILDDQKMNKEQLQKAVNFLEELISKNDLTQLTGEVKNLKAKRSSLIDQIYELEQKFLKCILGEYTPISFKAEGISPKDAAKFISEFREFLLVEGPIESDIAPITALELGELKAIIRSISPEDQDIIKSSIPDHENLVSPEDLNFLLNEKGNFSALKDEVRQREFQAFSKLDEEKLNQLHSALTESFSFVEDDPEDYLSAMMDFMLRGDNYVTTFENFVKDCQSSIEKIKDLSHLVFEYAPELESEHDLEELIKCAENIHDTAEKEVRFSFFGKLFNKEMQILKNEAKIQGRALKTKEEALSLVHFLKIKKERQFLANKWDNLISSRLGAISTSDFSKEIEEEVSFRLNGISRTLKQKGVIDSLRRDLDDLGITLPGAVYEDLKFKSKSLYQDLESTFEEIRIVVKEPLKVAFEDKRISALDSNYKKTLEILDTYSKHSIFNEELYKSYKDGDCEKYKFTFERLKKLNRSKDLYVKFEELISKINTAAPIFSTKILDRRIDDRILQMEDFEKIWKVSYLDYTLTNRNSNDPMKIQDSIIDGKNNLKRLDSVLIQKMSIMNQLQRITPRQRQALRGFVVAQNKMTKTGRGVRDDALRKESKIQMRECRGAVPVWIMPLSKVMDNFVIGEDAFDVLIIDEASQADITNLPIFSIAKKVIVVGDDKQVSPAAAGISLAGVDELINEFLQGVPNKAIYDYKASLYDIACSSFGETIRLTEHFRCTPEIIQFCNDLQYQGGIKALRESNSNPTPPSLVPYYVEGVMDGNKKNYQEAIKIASIIAAMTKMDKYSNCTIGVISLFGNVQHQLIDSFLRSILTTVAYEKHKITCGKAPQFQGDERNIMFLSLVESPTTEGPLRIKSGTDAQRKEYNVAVSRAKDQLWIFHSMNKDTQLQPDDIRLRLLKHANDPRDLMEKYSHLVSLAESPFEESVHQDLLRENYKFQPQYHVGAYRIDIVLFTSDGKRIALECDGDKYHSTEDQVRSDLERQAVLERLGFIFIRIRGSDYYRRKDETVNKLYQRLDELNVLKGNDEDNDRVLDTEIDHELLVEAEKVRAEIESLLEEGEIGEISDRPFNQRWGASKKKIVTKDKVQVPTNTEDIKDLFAEEKAINLPSEGSKFKYTKILNDFEFEQCLLCNSKFVLFNDSQKNELSFGYKSEESQQWLCKSCFRSNMNKNGWRT